jgi:hypothetical protein
VFRASVDRVAVDFVAVNADGRPLPNLAADEITLKVDGKPRDITSLELVRLVPATPRPNQRCRPPCRSSAVRFERTRGSGPARSSSCSTTRR